MQDDYDISKLKKKKRKNSRTKGNTFEKKVCEILNERFETKEFNRTPGSGAFGTTHANLPEHLKLHGDLITPLDFRFVIECKVGYGSRTLDGLFNDSEDIWKFIEQSEKDAQVSGKEPMILFKEDRRKILALVRKDQTFEEDPGYTGYHIITLDNKYKVYKLDDIINCSKELFFK